MSIKELLSNKKNTRFYEVFGKYECGLVLNSGSKKKILNYELSLSGSHGWIKNGEIFLRGFAKENIKLLLHRHEIEKIIRNVKEKKYLLIPSNLYLRNYKIKITLLLAKRNKYTSKQKLETIKRKDEKRLARFA
ncbi:single-stranded DNA-binding protein [Candidatus Mycoplasma haematobovis]|uniref:Single-stranded DNA-binding protein n=1 Tax=Candidatus Mycoplasma haematobovis TaxID=432608 RepID=A0A1A9QCN4_9MOLU|nr:SsrA-binding protein [Candidatus Mycoplasma haematobovis]OAL10342.1 single-stranded DNA-binding protein [Candidatus Mycoplasma haematobovis]